VRAAGAARLMPKLGHSHLWLADAILDVLVVNKLSIDHAPPLYRHLRRTNTLDDPTITWGVQ
jgi:hypothetical protein